MRQWAEWGLRPSVDLNPAGEGVAKCTFSVNSRVKIVRKIATVDE